MFKFTFGFLALVILLGVIGVFVTLKYPRPGFEALGEKLEQRMFQRSFFSVAICLAALGALITQAFDAKDILIVTVASLILKEFIMIKLLPGR